MGQRISADFRIVMIENSLSDERSHEIAITQILLAKGLIEDEILKNFINQISNEVDESAHFLRLPLNSIFTKINSRIRNYGLEIKTVVISFRNSLSYFHGIANTEDDFISKDHGSRFTAIELKYFSDIINTLIKTRRLSSQEAIKITSSLTENEKRKLLNKLESEQWLQRDDRSYWEFGKRTYLELSSYLQTLINNENDAEEEGETKSHGYVLTDLPQLIMY